MNRKSLLSFSGVMLSVLIVCSFMERLQNAMQTKPVPRVSIQAYQKMQGSNVIYTYKVANKSGKEIVIISIGFDRDADEPELSIHTVGWGSSSGDKKGSISSPTGWIGRTITQEESAHHWIQWEIQATENTGLLPGHDLGGFSVVVPKSDSKYKDGHFEIIFRDSTRTQGSIEYKGSF